MIVVVTGSRILVNHPMRLFLKQTFVERIASLEPAAVYHGGAKGPDLWAWEAFMDIQRCFRPEPDDSLTPAQQLFKRNRTMIDAAMDADNDLVLVACWDGKSKGTQHAMNYARDMVIDIVEITGTTLGGWS